MAHVYSGPTGRVFAQLVGEGQSDPFVQREVREHLVAPRRALIRAIWDRGVARGECAPTSTWRPRSIWCSARCYTGSSTATRRSTKRGSTRSSTRRCADSPPVTEITRIFGTLRAQLDVEISRN